LVLSTLHTNDAVSSALRLIDMGVDAFLVASSLKAIVAQRLVRRLCLSCKQPADTTLLYDHLLGSAHKNATFYGAVGCTRCLNTGYKGRLGVFEHITISDKLAAVLRKGDVQGFTDMATNEEGFVTLTENAMLLALSGETSLEEVQRISI